MFNFQKDTNQQHASNVFESFISSVNEQFHIKSDKHHTLSTEYLFSPVPNPLCGWSIKKSTKITALLLIHTERH